MSHNKIEIMNIATHPELGSLSLGTVGLEYSRHAVLRANERNFALAGGSVLLPAGSIVEIEREGNRTTKLVVRVSSTPVYDLVLVLAPKAPGLFFVKTAWLNKKTDKHATLRLDRLSA